MRIVNPGFRELFKEYGLNVYQDTFDGSSIADRVFNNQKTKIAEIMSNLGLEHYIATKKVSLSNNVSTSKPQVLRTHMDTAKNELWVSFCFFTPSYDNTLNRKTRYVSLQFVGTNVGVSIGRYEDYGGTYKIECIKLDETKYLVSPYYTKYNNIPDNDRFIEEPIDVVMSNTPTYVEVHIKTGSEGRIDIWVNNTLKGSYRSPSNITGSITDVNIYSNFVENATPIILHSFIFQDTGRIGLERLKKLTVSPDTDQTMPQNSTTNFTLSGLSDATEFSDITSIVPVIRTTSKDANITEGTFSIDGATIGTVDISDSSGKAVAAVTSTTNSVTGAPWTRDNIEGKTLSFKVNGAS